jgi:hypothetical protein
MHSMSLLGQAVGAECGDRGGDHCERRPGEGGRGPADLECSHHFLVAAEVDDHREERQQHDCVERLGDEDRGGRGDCEERSPSTTSAAAETALFGGLTGTTRPSDFP